MKVIQNFFADWCDILKKRLEVMGIDVNGLKNNEIVSAYFNLKERLIPPKSREIKRPEIFNVPPKYKDSLSNLENLVKAGGDLTPYLSRQVCSHFKKINKVDKLLSDWGIHHFHLGERMNNGKSINGTNELLFAMVDCKNFYEIGIFDHDSWCDTAMLKIIHENWPNLISRFKFRSIIKLDYNAEIAKMARETNIITPIQIGEDCYIPFGGGLTASGHSEIAEIKSDLERYKIQRLISEIETCKVPSFVGNEDSIKCRLVEDNNGVYVESIFFKKEINLL